MNHHGTSLFPIITTQVHKDGSLSPVHSRAQLHRARDTFAVVKKELRA